MFGQWIGAILQRIFVPAKAMGEVLQLVTALAIAGASTFFGATISEDSGARVLAYGGVAIGALLIIRLIWAPYTLWRDQARDIVLLRGRLNAPEHLIKKHMAIHQAEKRIEVLAILQSIISATTVVPDERKAKLGQVFSESLPTIAQAGLPLDFIHYVNISCQYFAEYEVGEPAHLKSNPVLICDSLAQYVVGAISLDQLAQRMPKVISDRLQQRADENVERYRVYQELQAAGVSAESAPKV